MRERPILFSGPMVRAERAGTKTQTRRVVAFTDDLPAEAIAGLPFISADKRVAVTFSWPVDKFTSGGTFRECPYGAPGDHLRVRETFLAYGRWVTRFNAKKGRDEWHFIDMTLECGHAYQYTADMEGELHATPAHRSTVTPGWWKRPAIFMPRVASRTLLEVTEIRAQRLQDISEADCRAEGIDREHCEFAPRAAYHQLWESINGAGSWDRNDWVWAVSFKRVTP